MALNTETSGERFVTMAVLIMSANTSGIVGSQIFQQEDRPLYRNGWTIIITLASFSLHVSSSQPSVSMFEPPREDKEGWFTVQLVKKSRSNILRLLSAIMNPLIIPVFLFDHIGS